MISPHGCDMSAHLVVFIAFLNFTFIIFSATQMMMIIMIRELRE